MRPEDFYTKPACNTAQRLKLFTHDGKDSGEWIEVYGIDSDAYEQAMADNQQKLLAIEITANMYKQTAMDAGNDTEAFHKSIAEQTKVYEDRQTIIKSREYETKASMVAGWSFKKEFSKANVIELFKNSPMIGQKLDLFITNRANFLKKK